MVKNDGATKPLNHTLYSHNEVSKVMLVPFSSSYKRSWGSPCENPCRTYGAFQLVMGDTRDTPKPNGQFIKGNFHENGG